MPKIKKHKVSRETTISFVVPCFNDSDTITKMVESIRDQDLPGIEIIAVNDGSTDNTKQVLDALKETGQVDKVIHLENNQGACVARNLGAKEASGKYLSFLPADAILYPGMARIWYNQLEEHPDYDFLYGGYRFITEDGEPIAGHEFFFEPFDPYLLETTNYIDGSFPIKRDAFWKYAEIMKQPDGLWDPKIKSLQDWDFWLSVVRNGGKGIYVQDIMFGTTLPHKGGLSDDSSNNWIDRTTTIKLKHGIPLRKTCVASLGAGFHAKRVAYILNADFKEMPAFKPHEYEAIYSIGYYPEFAKQQDSMFLNNLYAPQQGRTPAKSVVHFVGSDIWQLYHIPLISLRNVWQPYFRDAIDEILCEDEYTQAELKDLGIEAKVVPIPPVKLFDIRPLPKDFTVACYMPGVNRDFYRPNDMIAVAKALPDIKFKFFGNHAQKGTDPALPSNIEYMGYVTDMDKLISESSAIMRFPVHDGLPISVCEFLLAGRYSVQSIPMMHTLSLQANEFSVPKVIELVKKLKEQCEKEGLNMKAADYWRDRLSHEKYRKTMEKICSYQPKEYWEKRAKNWIPQAANMVTENADVKEFLDEIKPRSVIDIGCGDGRWYQFLKDNGVEKYKGTDISGNLINAAKVRFPGVDFQEVKVEDMQPEAEKFDLAFSYTTFEHIVEKDIEQAVKAVKGIAKQLLLIEPEDFKSRNYCHAHPYRTLFNVVKEKKIADKTIFLCQL